MASVTLPTGGSVPKGLESHTKEIKEIRIIDIVRKENSMIVVKEKKAVPHADVRCGNCGSLLQYGNADLHEDYGRSDGMTCAFQGHLRPYYFNCPVCGCKVNANWIINKGEEG